MLSGPVEGVGSVDTPGVTESGERTREPLVLRRGELALDDYESAAEVLYCSCVGRVALPANFPWRFGRLPILAFLDYFRGCDDSAGAS